MNWIKKSIGVLKWIVIGIMGLFILIFILLALDTIIHSTKTPILDPLKITAKKEYEQAIWELRFDSLKTEFGENKNLAEGYELQCLLALSHYPELKELSIDFVIKPAFLPLASRPAPLSVLFPWIRRQYFVVISNESTDFFEPILLSNTPFNEQVGIIGHELAHTIQYMNKNSLQISWIGISYLFEDFMRKFEREADKIGIAHGLGYQLYDFAFFVRKSFGDSQEKIATEEGGWYLSPREIAREMEKYEFYKEPLNPEDSYFED